MRLRIDSEPGQMAFGERISRHIRPPGVLYLEGELGTGKTTLARGILRGLGYMGPVRSPTYTLLEPYELAAMRLFHLDLYRVGDPEELHYLGLRDLLEEQSLLLVEWPDRGQGSLPPPDMVIRIRYAGAGRLLELLPQGARGAALEAGLRSTS